jgi:hypothetical protein
MVIEKFNPGDYIVTNEGLRGYIIHQVDESNTYAVRMVSGYTIVNEDDLKKDHLMEGF